MKVSEHVNPQASETMIPVLPCLDPDATLGFFQVLGFEVTYRMTKPYLYLALRRGAVEVHFGTGSSAIDPDEEMTGGCLVMVDAVEPYHRVFSEAMRAQYGRVLAKGRPRITRYRPGQTRFSIIDPSGNTLIFIERDEPALEYGGSNNLKGLARSIDSARVFREFKNDDGMAAKVLDAAIARHWDQASCIDRVRALCARAELAIMFDDRPTAAEMLQRMRSITLTDEEREALAAEVELVAKLEQWLA